MADTKTLGRHKMLKNLLTKIEECNTSEDMMLLDEEIVTGLKTIMADRSLSKEEKIDQANELYSATIIKGFEIFKEILKEEV